MSVRNVCEFDQDVFPWNLEKFSFPVESLQPQRLCYQRAGKKTMSDLTSFGCHAPVGIQMISKRLLRLTKGRSAQLYALHVCIVEHK